MYCKYNFQIREIFTSYSEYLCIFAKSNQLKKNKVMLLRFSVQNFLSFYDEVTFDMFPNPQRKLFQNRINTENKIPLLTQALIYGANGSGKSNFVKALGVLQGIVMDEDYLKGGDVNSAKFQLVEKNDKDTKFEVEFEMGGKYYLYNVSISDKLVEEFYESGVDEKEDRLIFRRDGFEVESSYFIGEGDQDRARMLLEKNPRSSIIPLTRKFPIFKEDIAFKAIEYWCGDRLKVMRINRNIPSLITMLSMDKDLYDYTNRLINQLDISDALTIKEVPLQEWLRTADNASEMEERLERQPVTEYMGVALDDLDGYTKGNIIKNEKGEDVVRELVFEQLGVGGYHKGLSAALQSDGTKRLLQIIPAVFYALSGYVVVIDEIENSMHPDLVYALMKTYSESNSKGQLIFTTHLARLQDQQRLVRPDEVWLTEKHEGCTKMRSMNDFKIHHTMNLENGYREGRYGGVPDIKEMSHE